MRCNIDERGRRIRIVAGAVMAIASAVLLAFGAALAVPAAFWSGVGTGAAGAFVLFEGFRGWCALRALGLRTPW